MIIIGAWPLFLLALIFMPMFRRLMGFLVLLILCILIWAHALAAPFLR
jgi:hypothetical protein